MEEVNAIIAELDSIINELEAIESELRSKFKGIYTEKCADAVNSKLQHFYKARKKLKNIDTTSVQEEVKKICM